MSSHPGGAGASAGSGANGGGDAAGVKGDGGSRNGDDGEHGASSSGPHGGGGPHHGQGQFGPSGSGVPRVSFIDEGGKILTFALTLTTAFSIRDAVSPALVCGDVMARWWDGSISSVIHPSAAPPNPLTRTHLHIRYTRTPPPCPTPFDPYYRWSTPYPTRWTVWFRPWCSPSACILPRLQRPPTCWPRHAYHTPWSR